MSRPTIAASGSYTKKLLADSFATEVLDLDAIRPLLLRAEEHHKHLVHYVDGEFECPWCQLSEAWQLWAKAGGQE